MLELKEARRLASEAGWLKDAPPSFQRIVLERTSPRSLKAGETLHYSGDDSIGMYGLLRGRLKVFVSAENHGPYLVHLLRPGDWIGEGPSITGRPRVVTPTASGDCELLFLARTAIHDIVAREPAYWGLFVLPLQGHFELAVGALADLLLRDHTKRIAAAILRLGGRRSGSAEERSRIEIDVSQEEIAIMANVARTTAGAALRDFATAGLIALAYGKIILLRPAKLRALASS